MAGLGRVLPYACWVSLILLLGSPAAAHEVRPAYLELQENAPGVFQGIWKQPALDQVRLPIDPQLPAECDVQTSQPGAHTGSALLEYFTAYCTLRTGTLTIAGLSRTLTDTMVKITYADGASRSFLLRPSSPSVDLAQATPSAFGYLKLGITHLLGGLDHVLFVAGLVLYIRGVWPLVKTVTSFTLAHSITLALSVLGLVSLPQGPVEAVIALSILFLARELVLPETRRSRLTQADPWIMAFAFGLLHGFGFAGVLAEIGLPRGDLALALALFNIGIELGQLLIIAALAGLIWLLTSLGRRPRSWISPPLAWGMGGIAGFWTIERVVAAL